MTQWTEEIVMAKTMQFTIPLGAAKPVIVKGNGVKVWDINGKEYIDCGAGPGVLNIGHCHPEVTEVIRRQVGELTQCPGRTYNCQTAALAEKLAQICPGNLTKSFFCNSGAEAVEGAMKVAFRAAYKRGKIAIGIMAFQHGFHGRLSMALALTGMTGRKGGFGAYTGFPGIVHVEPPYCYRCKFSYPDCGIYCAEKLTETVKTCGPGEFAIFIGEPILAVGGIIVPPKEYWSRVRDFCSRNSMLLIIDEVFTGFGRTGKMFAIEHWGIIPDIMTMGKALGGGLPIGGFITTDEVAGHIEGGGHYTTFGWNNVVSLAAGLRGIEVIEKEDLVENSCVMGELILRQLKALAEKTGVIGDVRGKGLLIGVEFVQDKKTKVPNPDATKKVSDALLAHGVIASPTGVWGNVIRIVPPLTINEEHVKQILGAFEIALKETGYLR